MWIILEGLFSKIWPYVLMALAVLSVIFGLYNTGRKAGKAAIEAKINNKIIKAQEKTIDEIMQANTIRDTISTLPIDRLRERDRFSRD